MSFRMAIPLLLYISASEVFGTTPSDLGIAAQSAYNHTDSKAALIESNPQRVRIPITLKAWNTVDTISTTGSKSATRIASKPTTQVLRARLEKSNDFYIGQLRVQTTPVRWLKRANQYQIRLEFFQRYPESEQLEEALGSVMLTGQLEKQDDGLYLLHGSARRTFRDRQGQPTIEFFAGEPPSQQQRPAISSYKTNSLR